MGVSLDVGTLDFTIPKHMKSAALHAINTWEYTDYTGKLNVLGEFDSLADAFDVWGFYPDESQEDFVLDGFQGEKYYLEIEEMFAAVAPFVCPGGTIEWVIEVDGYQQLYFDGHCLQVLAGHIQYEKPEVHASS